MENKERDEKSVFYREITLNHSFFKTQKHFINYCNKVIKERGLSHNLYTNKNLIILAWCLSNVNIFNRNRIDIPIDSFTWEIKTNEDSFPISDKLLENIEELIELKNRIKNIKQCNKLLETFPCLSEDKILDDLCSKLNFTEEFIKVINSCYQKPGVYFFYDLNNSLIYIGKSYNLYNRLQSSLMERRAFSCKILLTETESDCNILEMYFISLLKPPLNSGSITFDSPSFTINYEKEFSDIIKIFR